MTDLAGMQASLLAPGELGTSVFGAAAAGRAVAALTAAQPQVEAAIADIEEAIQSIEEAVLEAQETHLEAVGTGEPDNTGEGGDPAGDVP